MGSRISVPPRTFDQQLESFIAFIKENKITLIGVETKQLESDLKTQREQKQKDNEARRQYGQIHRKLLEDQAVRYARFGTAVQVVRVANRHNEDVLEAMEQFKRPRSRSGAKTVKAPAHPQP
jgi:lysyl-tRNA synthetase class I